MHRCIALLLLAAITPLLGCSSTLVRADKALSLSVGWEDYEHVEVDLASGSIDIMPQAGLDAVRIEGSLYARGATMAEAQRSLRSVDLRVEGGDERSLRIELPPSDLFGKNKHGADLVIRIPDTASARLVTRNGAVRAEELTDVRIQTGNGRVDVRGISGLLDIRSSNGAIVVDGVQAEVTARTSNGAIWASNVKGRCVLSTSNGAIDVSGTCESLSATTSNGSVTIRAHLPEQGVLQARSSNGRIDLAVPAHLRGSLRLRTSNGRVDIERVGAALTHASITRTGVRAEMNGGGAGLIEAVTSNGVIVVRDLP